MVIYKMGLACLMNNMSRTEESVGHAWSSDVMVLFHVDVFVDRGLCHMVPRSASSQVSRSTRPRTFRPCATTGQVRTQPDAPGAGGAQGA